MWTFSLFPDCQMNCHSSWFSQLFAREYFYLDQFLSFRSNSQKRMCTERYSCLTYRLQSFSATLLLLCYPFKSFLVRPDRQLSFQNSTEGIGFWPFGPTFKTNGPGRLMHTKSASVLFTNSCCLGKSAYFQIQMWLILIEPSKIFLFDIHTQFSSLH